MAIISATDFTDKPYKIPNQEESVEFVAFIELWETKLLKKLLGIDLYNEFTEALDGSNPDQKWIDLRDGGEYTYNNKTNEYLGIIEMIKPAIYSEWIKTISRKLTSTGVVTGTAQQNTTLADPVYEIVTNWNEYCKLAGANWSQCDTLYGFLKANETDYQNEDGELIFTPPQYKNQLDL